jgi:cytochrome P450
MANAGSANPAEDVTLSDISAWLTGIPHRHFADRRTHAPVEERDEPSVGRYWSITRHDDVRVISRDTIRFSSAQGVVLDELPPELQAISANMMHMDPPDHSRCATWCPAGSRYGSSRASGNGSAATPVRS